VTNQPIRVTYLLAVWGDQFIRQFMDLSLRSLLSPNNIPGLAEHTESTFIFLTRKSDRKSFGNHPLFKRLEHSCKVEFVTIDDLIYSGNYSATLTIAYERGMRHAGDAKMLQTYFIYLVADYVMADGSLLNLLPHMQRGVSGITAGNFQVVEEDMLEAFIQRINPMTGVLTLPPRELMKMTLPHLHPLTTANIVNQNYSHTDHTNRMFWRVDAETLIGRFYLRHMLCIKPELRDYIIGSSCDYSFIAEMCPSGNVVDITDSDEYCVIELQPFAHEQAFIRHGAFKMNVMLKSLRKWLTRTHRDNIFTPVVYHAGEITPAAKEMIETSQQFVEHVHSKLPKKTQPVRGHPYWLSCLEGVIENLITLKNQDDYYKRGVFGGIVGSKTFESPLGSARGDYNLLKMFRFRYGRDWRTAFIKMMRAISGTEAECRIWHREYSHARAINKAIGKAATNSDYFLLIVPEPTSYADWVFKRFGAQAVLQKSELFAVRPIATIQEAAPHASEAVIFLPAAYFHTLGELLAKCEQCLEGEKRVTVVIRQPYFARGTKPLKERLAILAAYYNSATVEIESFTTITNNMRKWLDSFYQQQANFILGCKPNFLSVVSRIVPAIAILFTNIGYMIGNLTSVRRKYPHIGDPTCAILRLRLTGRNRIVLSYERKLREEALYD